jgi:hypothetical protein
MTCLETIVLERREMTTPYPAEFLARLVHACPVLPELLLSWQTVCGGNQTLWAQMFTGRPRLESFTSVAVQGMEFTDRVLLSIAQNCAKLRSLEFRAAPTLTDAGIAALAQGCPKLGSQEVEGEASLTDAALYALAEHSRHLHSLILPDCNNFTAPAILHLLRSCPLTHCACPRPA